MSTEQIAPNIIIPSDPKSRKAIKDAIDEIGLHLSHIDSYKDKITEVLNTIKENYDIKPKYIRKLATNIHKNKVSEVQAENDDLDALYDIIVGNDGGTV